MSAAATPHGAGRRPRLALLPVQVAIAALLAATIVAGATKLRERGAGAAPPAPSVLPATDALIGEERPFGLLELERLLYLLRPAELGVPMWEPGQFARYAFLSENEETRDGGPARREVRFSVLRASEPHDAYPARFGMVHPDMFWLRLEALRVFREIPSDVYRLASARDLTLGPASPASDYQQGYIPFASNERDPVAERGCDLRRAGEEVLEVAGKQLACTRYDMVLRPEGPDGVEEPVGTLWHHPDVPPLGVVRLVGQSESIALVEHGMAAPSYPEGIAPLVEGQSTFIDMCHSCHGETCHDTVYPPH